MNEPTPPSVAPDLSAVMDALRERIAELDTDVHLRETRETGIVQRISQEVAAQFGIGRLKPDVNRVMERLIDRISETPVGVRFRDVGTVQHIGNGVATLSGLPRTRTDELMTFPTGVQGLILGLEHDRVDVVLLGSAEGIQGGDQVSATGERLQIPMGAGLLGRVLDPLGQPLDDLGPVDSVERRYLEREAPGIVEREPVDEPLLTGWLIVDALIPIGRGQRELIIGDRQTGKTTLAVDAILNQQGKDVACVYVAIGQKKSSTLAVIDTLREADALDYTAVVVSGPDDPPALRYLAPYAGCTLAERVMYEGRDVLIVYDDLSRHADAYRELSLLLRRPPGREAYPGDVFYLHARLLERACRLNEGAGGGSMTALPVVETQQGNLSAYIPTNLISITDGQILLDRDVFNQGIRPAVDVGRSVSRVGGAAQVSAMRGLASHLRLELSQYEEVARFARFGTEVDAATQRQIERGRRLRQLLTQPAHRPLSLAAQLILLKAAAEGVLDRVPVDEIAGFARALVARFEAAHPGLFSQMDRQREMPEGVHDAIRQAADAVCQDLLGRSC